MDQKVRLNTAQCKKLAEVVAPLAFRASHLHRPFLSFEAPRETKLRAYLLASAICHQTHTLIFKTKNLKGWACLEDVFTRLGQSDSELLKPEFLRTLTVDALVEKLKLNFAEDGNPDHCTLDRLPERAGFLIQIAKTLIDKYHGEVSLLLDKTGGFLSRGEEGFYKLMEEFEAFRDPLRKKSSVFLQLVHGAGLFEIKDWSSLEPVMDYHMQRLLLRTGCLEVVDGDLKRQLQTKEPMESDVDVRQAAVAAVKLISKLSGKNYFELDDILWSIGRSCCQVKMLCEDGFCNKQPCTFYTTVDLPRHDRCIFSDFCTGARDEAYRRYWQPMVETTFY